jgi:hypothetical protein
MVIHMPKLFFALLLCLYAAALAAAQQAGSQQDKSTAQAQPPGFIPPGDVNVRIEPDAERLDGGAHAAGFDNDLPANRFRRPEPSCEKTLLADPQLKEKLAAFYNAHRRPGVEESVDAARYAALSLLMTTPPAFSVYQSDDRPLPEFQHPCRCGCWCRGSSFVARVLLSKAASES